MNDIVDLKEIHARVLQIAKEFSAIMSRNFIPYYMLGGSMLGAIRHKGFVPWDDDMDFGIPRPYYLKAISLLENELPSHYHLLKATNGEVVYDGCKIEDSRTVVEEIGVSGFQRGLNIDIFPLDVSNNKWGVLSRNWWIKHIMGVNLYKYLWPDSIKERIVAIFVRMFPRNFFIKIARKLLRSEGNFFINYGGYWGAKEIVSRDIMGKPTLYHFCDTFFYGSQDYDGYLKCLYDNYMELPPIDKRHCHIKSFVVIE